MCGIAGILSQNKNSEDKHYIEKMCEVITHRGPDGYGFYSDEFISLGHRRLSIIDLSDNGLQPMCNEDETLWITYNGEIYNYQELRSDLAAKGHRFKSNTDTEVILHLFEEEKEGCLSKLRGMFAFAVWETKKKRLFCARDRLGIKPFHYFYDRNKFIFASEIKAILQHPNVARVLNRMALKDYLYFKYPVGDKSFFKDIFTLEPGHYLTVEDGKMNVCRYWDLNFNGENRNGIESVTEQLYEVLDESVRLHMISDVPLGTFLSGGIDSSSITSICSQNYPGKLSTFCCGAENEPENSDLKYAGKVSKTLGTDHHELILRPEDFGNFMKKAVWHLDEPGGGTTAIPGYFVAKLARENVKILLSGEGGDEVFGGYEFYIKYFIETNFMRFNSGRSISQFQLFKYLPKYLGMVRSRELFLRSLSRGILPKKKDYIEIRPHLDPTKYFRIISDDYLHDVSGYDPIENVHEKYLQDNGNKTFVDKIQYLDIKTYLYRILHIYDRMCMAVSLENRVPMLDYKLVEFGTTIPVAYRFYGLLPKFPLRMCLKGRLPDDVIERKKAGFSLPVGAWFRHELKDMVHNIIYSRNAKNRGIYNFNEIDKLWRQHLSGVNHTERIWSLISIELWHQLFIDKNVQE
jgi:asparagine synthase (glutamine-hydrolysing)